MYNYKLDFKLNQYQQQASDNLLLNIQQNKNILLEAVCGAGKTEMLLESIKYLLNQELIIGLACPRKTLLIDLHQRISTYFQSHQFGLVYGDYKYLNQAQLIFLTTHQLSKYQNYFDVLIIDEIDAFPFNDNYQLEKAAFKSAKQFIFVSATPPLKYLQANLVHLQVYHRHHLQMMPMPKLILSHSGRMWYELLKLCFALRKQPLIIFVPSIKLAQDLNRILKLFKFKSDWISSTKQDLKIIDNLKNKQINVLISTSVLERGITLKGLNIIIYQACSKLFSKDVLIQMCGRVGRDQKLYDGYIYFLAKTKTPSIIQCLEQIALINDKIEKQNRHSSL